jgi:hypothetical protein
MDGSRFSSEKNTLSIEYLVNQLAPGLEQLAHSGENQLAVVR